jgi:hypothetical protein
MNNAVMANSNDGIEDGCSGFHVSQFVGNGEVEEQHGSVDEEFTLPDDDEIEWLRSQAKEEPPEDEGCSPAERNAVIMRGILAFAPAVPTVRGRAAIRRTRQLRMLDAGRASRHLATDRARRRVARVQPRSRAARRSRTHRATAARTAASDGGPAPAPTVIVALQKRDPSWWTATCPEVGRG